MGAEGCASVQSAHSDCVCLTGPGFVVLFLVSLVTRWDFWSCLEWCSNSKKYTKQLDKWNMSLTIRKWCCILNKRERNSHFGDCRMCQVGSEQSLVWLSYCIQYSGTGGSVCQEAERFYWVLSIFCSHWLHWRPLRELSTLEGDCRLWHLTHINEIISLRGVCISLPPKFQITLLLKVGTNILLMARMHLLVIFT